MSIDVAVCVVAGLLLLVALIGAVYPVLPGSLIAILTLLAWAAIMGSWEAWVAGVVAALIAVAGWSASYVLTGRKLKEQRIPGRSIVVAVIAGVIGIFLIPVVGLFVGFAAGLFVAEYLRHRDLRASVTSSAVTLKATLTGMLIEAGMLCLAGSVWAIGVIAHFAMG
jgi:uncharacterized protein YqgC (DUF456 family)